MQSSKSDHNQAKLLEKLLVHPFSLQGLSASSFIEVTNKILSGEFGLLSFKNRHSQVQPDLWHV